MSEPERLAIALFPLHTVLFPGGLLPLRVFEQRYLHMVATCLRENQPFGVCLISEGGEVGTPARPHPVGCIARIVQWDMQQLGMLNITAQGERRFRILERRVENDGLTRCDAELLAAEDDAPVSQQHALCVRLLKTIADDGGGTAFAQPLRFESASWVGGRLAEILPLPLEFKQRLLEMDQSVQRLEALRQVLRDYKLARPG